MRSRFVILNQTSIDPLRILGLDNLLLLDPINAMLSMAGGLGLIFAYARAAVVALWCIPTKE